MSDPNKQHHSIQEMLFDVQFNSENEAFRFQYTLSHLIKDKLLDITEKVLNELVPAHQLIQVKSLVIDLETIPLKHFERDVPELYERQLRESLGALLFRLKGVSYSAVDDAEISSPDAGLSKVLGIFLKTGTLPWWAKNAWQAYLTQNKEYTDEKLEITKIFEIVFQSTPELLIQLIEKSQNDQQVLYRLADQIPNYQLLEVIKAISPERSTRLKRIIQDFEKISSPKFLSLVQEQVRVVVWQVIFLNWDSNKEEVIIQKTLDKLLALANQPIQQVEAFFFQLSIDKLSLNPYLASSLQQLTTTVSREKLQKEVYASEEKIRHLLLQLLSEEEAEIVMAYAKNVQGILKHLSKQQIWESILDYLWESTHNAFNINLLSAKVLPQLTHNWEQAAKQLQITFDHQTLTLKDFSKDIIEATQNADTSERIKELLSQIVDTNQVEWFWKYGNTLTTLLDATSTQVWETILDSLWELRRQTFTRQRFLKKTFPQIWKKLVPKVAIPSSIPTLQGQKMWTIPPAPVLAQLAQEIEEVKNISAQYWATALSTNELTQDVVSGKTQPTLQGSTAFSSSEDLPPSNNEATSSTSSEKYNTQDIKKTEMSQALDDGKIIELIEQVLPGQSSWMSEYVKIITRVFKLEEKVAWEQIIDFLWETRQAGFERNLFLINSFATITDQVTTSLNTYERWQFKKTKIQEVLSHYPEFVKADQDVVLASLYQNVNQIRKAFLQQNITTDVQEVLEKLFTKGILPAVAQVQRSLAHTANQPVVSLEETIANLVEAAFNNQYYSLSQLLNVHILQRFIEQTSEEFVYKLVTQIIEIDPSVYISDRLAVFLQSIPAFENWDFAEGLGFKSKTLPHTIDDKRPSTGKDEIDDDTKSDQQAQDAKQKEETTDDTTQEVDQGQTIDGKEKRESTDSDQTIDDKEKRESSDSDQTINGKGKRESTDSDQTIDDKEKRESSDSDQTINGKEKRESTDSDQTIDGKEKRESSDSDQTIDDKEKKKGTDQEQSKSTDPSLPIIDAESIVEDIDLLIYYLRYFLIQKQLPKNIVNADINIWLKALKTNYSTNFQHFALSLSSAEIDLLAKQTPEIIQWVDDVWIHTTKQKKQETGDTVEQSKAEAIEKETYERIKKEIFKSANEQRKQVVDQPMYVNNAGLIILHPYLLRLFEMLKLTETTVTETPLPQNPHKKRKKSKVNFKGDAEKERAVYILQYLATKTEEAGEHELVLNKVLCGMEITEPFISGKVILTDEEKETCEELLEAVVQNWSILKDSPADTLRGSFFIREGRLEIKEGNWFLKIEESGVDVLLQQLPWSIGMIKLPWMPKVMNVEWLV
ncbi:contractile injection system tape measure protein [uncultured Microscilla sp.]|uniref:contractile injection system tape measure protein n=1 Tax=uncultured Microscilla sp. TaxID=432653 RepID=UPI002618528E|nr:contractile injection system tape measure protein [uncultured Microscilla sp.]